MQFTSIWPIDRTLSGATTLDESETGSDGNDGVLRNPQSSNISRAWPSDCLVLYPGYLFGAGVLAYSAAPANLATVKEKENSLTWGPPLNTNHQEISYMNTYAKLA